jgi:clan AA aspartic protease
MGLITTMLTLANPRRPGIAPVRVEALADTGSVYLILPEAVRRELDLEIDADRTVTLADGSKRSVPYAGPVEVRFKNRLAFVGAIVMGDQVLLGAIPMEDMDLVLVPGTRSIDVNPASPDIASAHAKCALSAD